jgi:hypothetical protein
VGVKKIDLFSLSLTVVVRHDHLFGLACEVATILLLQAGDALANQLHGGGRWDRASV